MDYVKQCLTIGAINSETQRDLLLKAAAPEGTDKRCIKCPEIVLYENNLPEKVYCTRHLAEKICQSRNNSRGPQLLLVIQPAEGRDTIVLEEFIYIRAGVLYVGESPIEHYGIEMISSSLAGSRIKITVSADFANILRPGNYLVTIRGRNICKSLTAGELCYSTKNHLPTSFIDGTVPPGVPYWKIKYARITTCEYCYACSLVRFAGEMPALLAARQEILSLKQEISSKNEVIEKLRKNKTKKNEKTHFSNM